MKNTHPIVSLAALSAVAGLSGMAHADIYNGNGNAGFGGPVGQGTIEITEAGGTYSFNLDLLDGQDLGGNVLVLYIDSVAGGFGDTSSFMDNADGGRRAISGFNANDGNNPNDDTRTLATFVAGFQADFAIAFGSSFAGLFQLASGGDNSLIFVDGDGQDGTEPYLVSFDASQLGQGSSNGFNFVGTLISDSAFRSNETFGDALFFDGAGGATGDNPGFNGSVVFTESLTFVVPEPTSLALLGLGGLAMLRRKR